MKIVGHKSVVAVKQTIYVLSEKFCKKKMSKDLFFKGCKIKEHFCTLAYIYIYILYIYIDGA